MIESSTKILFVDNDNNILNALQQLMGDEDWSCSFISCPVEALELLETETIDLLVAGDLLLGDGSCLLAKAKELHPTVIRLLLTNPTQQEKITAALGQNQAQQIVPKPWIDQEFKEIIRSALRQSAQQKKRSLGFQALINSIPLLPALPENYSQVQDCIINDEVNIEKMADIIRQDVAMSSAMLHWANSALFGQRFRVDTIKKAIVVLGTDIVINLILSDAVTNSMTSSTPQIKGFALSKFKHHSIAVAILSRLLIKSLYSSDTDLQDRAFIAGLLHDMGKLITAKHFPKQFTAASRLAEQVACPFYEAESRAWGTSHAELGSFLAEWWALPHFIVTAIALHHVPKSSPIDPEVVNAVYLANQLSYRFGFGCNGEKVAREIDQELWDKFFLTDEGLEILQVETDSVMKVLGS